MAGTEMRHGIGQTPTRQEFLEFYTPAVSALPLPKLPTTTGAIKQPTADETLKKLESGSPK